MDPLILIIASDSRSQQNALRRLPGDHFSWVYLGQRIDHFYKVKQAFQDLGTHLDTVPRFHEASEALRESYLAYLYSIGRELNCLRWWITSLSYRSSYASETFRQACYLKIALDLVRSWEGPEPLVVVADKPLRRALERNLAGHRGVKVHVMGPHQSFPLRWAHDLTSMLAHRAIFMLREGRRIFQSRWMIPRRYVPTVETTLILSGATPSNLSRGGEFHTSFFGDLAVRLNELGCRVAIVPMIPPSVRYKGALLRLQEGSYPLLVPHRYLSFPDLIRTVISSLTKPPLPRSIPALCGMDISPLIKEDLRTHWVSNQVMEPLMIAALVRHWAVLGLSIARIIYIYENQPWERALCWEVRRSLPGAKLVGYQHARLPLMELNWFLAPGEESDAPLPDRVVTVGKHSARLMTDDGYAPTRIRVGGAIQMQSLSDPGCQSVDSAASKTGGVVLVSSSNGLEETAELAWMAMYLFDEDEGIRILMKCHPIMPFEKVSGIIGGELSTHVEVSDEPVIDLMRNSSVMVYSASTVCIQALAIGLPVVHLRPQFDFDLDPLEAVPDVRLEATGLDELRQKVRWLLEHRAEYIRQHRERWKFVTEEMYGQVSEETFRAFVE